MALFSPRESARQVKLHTHNDINALAAMFADSVPTASPKPTPQLAFQAQPNVAPASRRASSARPKYRAAPMSKRVQLSCRLSVELRDAVAAAAGARRITMTAAMCEALTHWVRRQRQ